MMRPAELEWRGFELAGGDLLRATVKVTGARQARVTVTFALDGRIIDLQATDDLAAGTTGDVALDDAVIELVRERLTLARDVEVYRQAVRRRGFDDAPRKPRR